MSTKNIEIILKGESYDCFIRDGDIMNIHAEIPFQAGVAMGVKEAHELYTVRRLSGLWLRIAAVLAEEGELGV